MKWLRSCLGAAAAAVTLFGCSGDRSAAEPAPRAGVAISDSTALLRINTEPLAADWPAYGLNLGGSGTWGAEQLRANVLANPGFESIVDRAIVVVSEVDGVRFTDDTGWLARPDGFWAGASYDVRSGAAAGRRGQILDSTRKPGNGPALLFSDVAVDLLRPGDVVALTRDVDTTVAPHWWKGQGRVAVSKEVPPRSTGQQSLRLLAIPGQPAEILHYLDSIFDRAGKLLPVNGKWKLSFWARQVKPGASLRVRFDRMGGAIFLDTVIAPELAWKRHEIEFDARDEGPPGVLTLGFTAKDGEVLIDEAYLGEADIGPGGFRRLVVETLRSLRPGYLRDWQGQLGDTLENRLSGEMAHRPARYRSGEGESQFHYGLPDFLALCAAVKAQPWVVAPTTLSDEEWRALGAYLRSAANQYAFREVLVEFGNENWNTIFRPAGIPNVATLAQVADRGFGYLREGARNDPRLHTVVNAQYVNPDGPAQLGALSSQTDHVSVAPYFMYRLDAGTSPGDARKAAFAEDSNLLLQEAATASKQGKRLTAYEVNFHTTLGTASSDQRNQITTSAAAGPALARRLLQASLAGVRQQAVYSFSGFDSYVDGSKALVRLWGITRDLASQDRFRPTGLALAMLNRVAGGSAHAVECVGKNCPALTGMAFSGGAMLALVSSSAEAVPVVWATDCQATANYTLRLLDGSDIQRNNEALPEVAVGEGILACQRDQLAFTLPPYSLATLQPSAAK